MAVTRMADFLVIVPSRGRPESVARVVEAWHATGAFGSADLLFAIDGDDPYSGAYLASVPSGTAGLVALPQWKPMVRKLNEVAVERVNEYFALGFAGDDHLPRTPGWAGRYVDALYELGTGIVYGDDLIQREQLPTQWAMTADIVRALGRMVPADVEHLYCDNAVADLGRCAGCLRYLPDVVVEHVHPIAGKAPMDLGYVRVNRPEQYRRDGAAYQRWVAEQLETDAATVRALRAQPVDDDAGVSVLGEV